MPFTPAAGRKGVLKVKITSTFTTINGLFEIPEMGGKVNTYETAYINSTLPSVSLDMIALDEYTVTGDVDLKNDTTQAHLLASYALNAAGTKTVDDFEADFNSGMKGTFSGLVTMFSISAKGGENERFTCTIKRTTDVTITAAP